MHGLIGLDALIILNSFFGFIVTLEPNKKSIYTFNSFQILMLITRLKFQIIRFILSVIFLESSSPDAIFHE